MPIRVLPVGDHLTFTAAWLATGPDRWLGRRCAPGGTQPTERKPHPRLLPLNP